uniref:Uncharacterized protein n=1 Tax=Rhizophora mucronata TaxID=61149 RepID=A0A2P2IV45_RHIMU
MWPLKIIGPFMAIRNSGPIIKPCCCKIHFPQSLFVI